MGQEHPKICGHINQPQTTCSSEANINIEIPHEPVSQTLYRNDGVVISLLFFLFSSLYIIAKSKHHIKTQLKHLFFRSTDHHSTFTSRSGREKRYSLCLLLQSCYFFGLTFFYYTTNCGTANGKQPFLSTIIYALIILALIGLKILAYKGVNYIFFENTAIKAWEKTYFFILSSLGVLLLPLAIIMIFWQPTILFVSIYTCFLLFIAKTLIGYKTYITFFSDIYGFIHFIAYLCALEMLPSGILWKTLIITNKYF